MLPIVQIFFFFNLNFFWTQPTSENLQNVVLFKVLFQLQFQFRLVCFQPRATPSFLATLKKRSTVNEPWPVEHFLVGSTGWLVIIIISQLSLSVCLSLSRQEDQTFHLHPICIFSRVRWSVLYLWCDTDRPPPTLPLLWSPHIKDTLHLSFSLFLPVGCRCCNSLLTFRNIWDPGHTVE